MARMHSGARGKSGSKRPAGRSLPKWVELKPKEAEEGIISLANAGHTGSEIGMIMRDLYGVPDVKALTGRKLDDILKTHNLLPEIPEDLMSLIRKSVKLRKHQQNNKKDFTSKRGYQLTVSKIRRLVKYYVKRGRLPKGWRFSEEKAALLVK